MNDNLLKNGQTSFAPTTGFAVRPSSSWTTTLSSSALPSASPPSSQPTIQRQVVVEHAPTFSGDGHRSMASDFDMSGIRDNDDDPTLSSVAGKTSKLRPGC